MGDRNPFAGVPAPFGPDGPFPVPPPEVAEAMRQAGASFGLMMEFSMKVGAIVNTGDDALIARLANMLDQLLAEVPSGDAAPGA